MAEEKAVTPEQRVSIETLIARLERHQKALGASDAAFINRYSEYIGTDRTWVHRLKKRDFSEIDVPKRIALLQELVTKLDGGSARPERFFWEMPFTKQVDALVSMLRTQETDRRNVFVLATTGCGKSALAKIIVAQNPRECAYMRLHDGCRNHETNILKRFGFALGLGEDGTKQTLFPRIIAHLQANPQIIFIDEAHSGGFKLFHLVKTLIDETPAKFVQLAYPTEFDRVRTATAGAMDEAKQLLGRTIKPIFDDYREGLRVADIVCYLKQCGLPEDDARAVAPEIMPMVRANGNLRVLDDAVRDATLVCRRQDRPVDVATVREAVEAQCPARRR
jgi:DNA transposition AAA+ family ATPase